MTVRKCNTLYDENTAKTEFAVTPEFKKKKNVKLKIKNKSLKKYFVVTSNSRRHNWKINLLTVNAPFI